jgi:hypothetical protein
MSEWISVSDRLPEYDGDEILVFFASLGFMTLSSYESGSKTPWDFDIASMNKTSQDLVTHWQPLPPPPD